MIRLVIPESCVSRGTFQSLRETWALPETCLCTDLLSLCGGAAALCSIQVHRTGLAMNKTLPLQRPVPLKAQICRELTLSLQRGSSIFIKTLLPGLQPGPLQAPSDKPWELQDEQACRGVRLGNSSIFIIVGIQTNLGKCHGTCGHHTEDHYVGLILFSMN